MSDHPRKPHLPRRGLIKFAGASLLLLVTPVGAAVNRQPGVLAVRVWPAADYTRVTIELGAPLKFSHFTVKNPERLVVDLEGRLLEGSGRPSTETPMHLLCYRRRGDVGWSGRGCGFDGQRGHFLGSYGCGWAGCGVSRRARAP